MPVSSCCKARLKSQRQGQKCAIRGSPDGSALRRSERKIEHVALRSLKPSKRNARTHSQKQIRQIANSILKFGWVVPIIVDEDGNIIAGVGRYDAAKLLGLTYVPVIVVTGLSAPERAWPFQSIAGGRRTAVPISTHATC